MGDKADSREYVWETKQMRLIVKKDGQTVNDFRFERGPVYIGRHEHSQIFLPDRAVSRQHAAIFATRDGTWVLEDLDSANKTFLNDKAIHKAPIKTGDHIRIGIRIGIFEIEVTLDADAGKPIHLDDTLMPASRESGPATVPAREIIVRKPDAERAPDIQLPAMRVKDFLEATEGEGFPGGHRGDLQIQRSRRGAQDPAGNHIAVPGAQ